MRCLLAYATYWFGQALRPLLLSDLVVARGGYRIWNELMIASMDVQDAGPGPWRSAREDDPATLTRGHSGG